MIRPLSISCRRRLSVGLLAAISSCVAISEADENGVIIPAKPPGWWAEELGEQSQLLWDKVREGGKITTGELLDLAFAGNLSEENDEPVTAARLLGCWHEDPVPALRGMMAGTDPLKRAFAATVAGRLGDVRLEPELERLLEDKAALGKFPGLWFAGDTVGEAAASAMEKLLETDPVRQSERAARIGKAPWLTLRPAPSTGMKAAMEQARKRHYEGLETAAAVYRKDLAEAISAAMEIEVFLLDFETEKVDSGHYHWDTRQPRDRFPIVPYGSTSRILQRKRLSQDEVKALMPSLKATVGVEKNTYGAMCHFPVHGIRIRNGADVIFQTSICYECMNFYVEYSDGGQEASWTGLSSKEFQEVMMRLMPVPASQIERFEKMKVGAGSK
jgi:hypothetical protein